MGGQSFKKIVIIIIIIVIGGGIFYIVFPYLNSLNGDNIQKKIIYHQTSNDPTPFIISNKGVNLKVKIADTETEREQGLSGTFGLDDNEGMLFVFEKPDYYRMWMKGMLYSLDIIWLDQNFNIIKILKDVSPSTYPESFGPGTRAQYVLEINSGLSDKYGFVLGDQFKAVDASNDF